MTARYPARNVLTVTIVLGVVVAWSGSAQAAPAIYEPFNYPVYSGEGDPDPNTVPLNGLGGTTEVGLDGTWNAHSQSLVVADSLTYGDLPTSGGSVGQLAYYSNRYGGTRTVNAAALASNGLLNDGATLWFSLEMGYGRNSAGTPANLSNATLAFALANNQFSGGNYAYQILDEGEQLGQGLGVNLGKPNGNGQPMAALYRDQSFGTSGFAGAVFGDFSGTALANDEHGLFIAKIVWGATSGDLDTIDIYQPDVDLVLPDSPISTLQVTVDQSTFDVITWHYGDPMVMDEIRFGATYEDVLGNPPPPPVLTLRVDPVTGATTLLGDEYQDVDVTYYEITSESDSLDPENWSSLMDQDFEGSGPPSGTGDGWEEAGGTGTHALAEAFLLGDSTIDAAQSVDLGMGYDAFVGAEDLVFTYLTDEGEVIAGLVEYISSIIPGDANWDGVVDAADYIALKQNFGAASGATYHDGDFDGDHDVDLDDLAILKAYFGQGPEESPAIPEPATLSLMGLAGLVVLRRRRAA